LEHIKGVISSPGAANLTGARGGERGRQQLKSLTLAAVQQQHGSSCNTNSTSATLTLCGHKSLRNLFKFIIKILVNDKVLKTNFNVWNSLNINT